MTSLRETIDRLKIAAANGDFEAPEIDADAVRETRQRVDSLASDLGKRYGPTLATLDRFEIYHEAQKQPYAKLCGIAAGIGEFVTSSRGLVLLGTVGTGKDHLLAALLYAAAKAGHSARWVNGQEVFGQFRDRIDTGKADEGHFRELSAPTVLGISDPIPPIGQAGAWDLGNLYRLLDRRYRAMKSTWVTINAQTPDEADAKLSEPVFDRLRDGAEIVTCCWPSYRERPPIR